MLGKYIAAIFSK